MNWDALGAIGEIVGAAGVIATLAYLAVQVRHNTRAVRSATLNAVTQAKRDELRWSSEIATPMRKALHTPDDMSEEDTWHVTEWMTAAFLARQNEYSQFTQGLLDADQWEQSEHIIRLLTGMEWFQKWWTPYGKDIYSRAFVARVELIMAGEGFDYSGAMKEIEEGEGHGGDTE